ncbi:hypothetical protein C8Q74DRAFT_1297179 [Fomes fomentarius]|nr:hypothetical protein C8Q74DRAFT_1297179 [Fomes fomentarius]
MTSSWSTGTRRFSGHRRRRRLLLFAHALLETSCTCIVILSSHRTGSELFDCWTCLFSCIRQHLLSEIEGAYHQADRHRARIGLLDCWTGLFSRIRQQLGRILSVLSSRQTISIFGSCGNYDG